MPDFSGSNMPPELTRLAQSSRLRFIGHRANWLRQAVEMGRDWARVVAAVRVSDAVERYDGIVSGVGPACDQSKAMAAGDLATAGEIEALRDALRGLATLGNGAANALRGLFADIPQNLAPDAVAHDIWPIVRDLETAALGLLMDAYWLASVASRLRLADAPVAATARHTRMRARRALGFRSVTINLHESDLLALGRLGLLPALSGRRIAPEDLECAADAFMAAALAVAVEETKEPEQRTGLYHETKDPLGVWRFRPFMSRLSDLVRAYSSGRLP